MKILLLSSTNDWTNGYGNITHEYMRHIDGRHDVTLLLPQGEERGLHIGYSPRYVLPPYVFNLKTPKVLEYMNFDFDASSYDVIHSLFEFPYALLAAKLARKYRKSLIIGTQGTYAIQPLFWYPERWLVKWAYGVASLITAPSAFTRDNLTRYSDTQTPVRILHNAVNVDRFRGDVDVSSIRSRWPGKKILLTVGGLKPRKGQDIVIRALGLLNDRRDIQYVMVGVGKMQDSYRALASELGVSDRVTFVGAVEGEELVRYFHACDIYIHTPVLSDWQFEGFGIVYLEASACRKPIIASDSGGVRDAVIADETGVIVPESDERATAHAITTLLDDPALMQRLGERGYDYAASHTWQSYIEQISNYYDEVKTQH